MILPADQTYKQKEDSAAKTCRKELVALIEDETGQTPPQPTAMIAAELIKLIPQAKVILFYGSGLWKEKPDADTVYDFYVLVDHYRDADMRWHVPLLGALLPPNVYYKEFTDQKTGLLYRCKYAVITATQFTRAAKGFSATPQIWARFAQPVRILYARNEQSRNEITNALADAVLSFHRKTLPLIKADSADARTIWLNGLMETYAREWRSEDQSRAATLYDAATDGFAMRTALALPLTGMTKREDGQRYRLSISPRQKIIAQVFNPAKRFIAKSVAFFRLLKALVTFEGAVDYALYKIERQSGVKVEASDFQRRYPLIGVWPLLWAVYKKGGFR